MDFGQLWQRITGFFSGLFTTTATLNTNPSGMPNINIGGPNLGPNPAGGSAASLGTGAGTGRTSAAPATTASTAGMYNFKIPTVGETTLHWLEDGSGLQVVWNGRTSGRDRWGTISQDTTSVQERNPTTGQTEYRRLQDVTLGVIPASAFEGRGLALVYDPAMNSRADIARETHPQLRGRPILGGLNENMVALHHHLEDIGSPGITIASTTRNFNPRIGVGVSNLLAGPNISNRTLGEMQLGWARVGANNLAYQGQQQALEGRALQQYSPQNQRFQAVAGYLNRVREARNQYLYGVGGMASPGALDAAMNNAVFWQGINASIAPIVNEDIAGYNRYAARHPGQWPFGILPPHRGR